MISFILDDRLLHQVRDVNYLFSQKKALLQSFSPEKLESIHLLARVSQVGASTRIENALLTDSEVEWLDTLLTREAHVSSFENQKNLIENKLSKDRERSIEEVAGCRAMLFLIYEQYGDFFPLTETVLRGLHQELLQYYSKASHYWGRYKTVTNSVVAYDHGTGESRIVFHTADPGPLTEAAMRDLVSWYNREGPQYPWSVAVACELTFRFLAIHPFQDGNGRVGRGLFLLALLQSPDPVISFVARYLTIDRQIEKYKEEYYRVLQRCSDGKFRIDPQEYQTQFFCQYMLKVLKAALEDIDHYATRYDRIQALPESAHRLFDCFKEYPEKRLTVKDLLQATPLPRRTINYALNLLLDAHLLRRYGQGRGTRYQVMF